MPRDTLRGVIAGLFRGAVIGFLLGIAWNTSAQTSVIEGGRRHLTFGQVILIAVAAGLVGLLAGALATAQRSIRRRGNSG